MVGESSETAASLPYHEPSIIIILVHTSFLLLLNVVNAALDNLLYCGLLGQVLIGVAWGTPGAQWLSASVEETVVQLGYLGLILLVYEGGLHTSFKSLQANLLLSTGVALTGIAVPIGLSYTLQGLLNASPLQAFAAGAALCSTSLGTTFTVLGSSGLSNSRLGVVLTSAAMMDDVVGLVMVQVISNLGGANFSWITVVRPVLVSIAFAVITPIVCLFVVRPLTIMLNSYRESHAAGRVNSTLRRPQAAFTIHSLLLIGLVAGATYAGTSNLFSAYIAGASISWWDSELPHPTTLVGPADESDVKGKARDAEPLQEPTEAPSSKIAQDATTPKKAAVGHGAENSNALGEKSSSDSNLRKPEDDTSGSTIYHRYYRPAVSKILQPLFFASIGFSIPITRMFRGAIVWRGIVYTALMALAKLVCGLWLVRFSFGPVMSTVKRLLSKVKLPVGAHFWGRKDRVAPTTQASATVAPSPSSPTPPKPFSLHPPLILALAMCARGEIGFLISGVAESKGIFSPSGEPSAEPSDIFLVVTWAIVLCTILGPFGVGLSVRRVKKLQERKSKQQDGAGRDVLGVWGVE
ncbi:Sodium/hydrogen exchanger [Pyrenochaeta sp. DS3sAY3a]|nr:Sodium/hydrogen exchanger [Pyrenochaeta sp. DS3sAY3a]